MFIIFGKTNFGSTRFGTITILQVHVDYIHITPGKHGIVETFRWVEWSVSGIVSELCMMIDLNEIEDSGAIHKIS